MYCPGILAKQFFAVREKESAISTLRNRGAQAG